MSEQGPIQDVNIELGDEVSRMLYEASKLTHQNRPGLLVEFHKSFSGLRAIPLSIFKDPENLCMNMDSDGVGTKVEVSERLEDHSVIAHDLFAMACDDAVVRGAEPIAVSSILDVRQLDDTEYTRTAIQQLAQGYVEAAEAAGVVVVNGEAAELGDRVGGYGPFSYNWGATALWIAHQSRVLSGHQIRPGDALVGLAEPGFRSNGITDVRKTMLKEYGPEWHDAVVDSLGGLSLGRLVQRPSVIYSKFMTELTGGYDIEREPKAKVTGAAPITGGGQPSKLRRMLEPSGLGAVIDTPIEPPAIMLHTQSLTDLSDYDVYGKWHMGPGMILATPEPADILAEAEKADIGAQVIGVITDESRIVIKNRGIRQKNRWLYF